MTRKKWSKEIIVRMITEMKNQNIDLSTRNIFKNKVTLYSAACRYFENWANAVWIAGVNYDQIINEGKSSRREKLKKWSRTRILGEIKKTLSLNPLASYRDEPALYSAARREFKSWKDALEQAGFAMKRKTRTAVSVYAPVLKNNRVEREIEKGPILIVDDNLFDCLLIHKAMKANGVENRVRFMEDGQVLMDHLSENLKVSQPDQAPELPSLIVMDIHMPRMDGHETLKNLKGDSRLKEIPVVILSNSSDLKEMDDSYQEGANSFFSKPPDYRELVDLMGLLKNHWLQRKPLSSAGA
jgi:two-component system, response regulator